MDTDALRGQHPPVHPPSSAKHTHTVKRAQCLLCTQDGTEVLDGGKDLLHFVWGIEGRDEDRQRHQMYDLPVRACVRVCVCVCVRACACVRRVCVCPWAIGRCAV